MEETHRHGGRSIKAELNADGTGSDLKYETKLPIDPANMEIKVGDKVVATGSAVSVATASGETKTVSGSAVYAYTPDADGEIKFTVSVAEGSEGYNITWKALNDATVKVVVTGDGKTITLDKPGTIKLADIKAGVKYTVTITAEKANYVLKTEVKEL